MDTLRLAYPGLPVLELSNEYFNTVVIENPAFLYEYTVNLYAQCSGGVGKFILSDKNREMRLGDCAEFIPDFYTFDINSKKIISGLTKRLTESIKRSAHEFTELHSACIDFLQKAAGDLNMDFDFATAPSISSLVKFCGLTLSERGTGLLCKLTSYADALSEFTDCRILITANLRKFLSVDESTAFQKHCRYREIYLLNLESVFSGTLSDERPLIIDKDLCEMLVNYP